MTLSLDVSLLLFNFDINFCIALKGTLRRHKANKRSMHWDLQTYLGTESKAKLYRSHSLQKSVDIYPNMESLSSIEHEDRNQNIMQLTTFSYPTELHFIGNINIRKIVWTENIALFLSDDGTLYSSGVDTKKKGTLGLGEKYEQLNLATIPALSEYKIKTMSICETHACATDSTGKLFTWGTSPNGALGHGSTTTCLTPTLVNIDKAVEVKESKVCQGYTAFKTAGGYLYILGSINSQKSFVAVYNTEEGILKQVQGITNYFIRTFWCSEQFIAILTQTGEIIYVDEYLKTTKVYTDSCKHSKSKDERFEFITLTKGGIVALSRNKLYLWKPIKARPPVHPRGFAQRKRSANPNQTSMENSRGTLSSERNMMEKYLYNTFDQTAKVGSIRD